MRPVATPESGTVSRSEDTHVDETDDQLIQADDLIEEVSIDGMCGVY
ncbi:mycofactocin precursor MftA [Streptomyces sp. NPDC050264]